MRDRRFVAVHRGGLLLKEQHQKLMKWACACAKHVLPLIGEIEDVRLINALDVAEKWVEGNASVSDARKASLEAIAVAHESSSPICIAVARSIGHAVATAHMADHSLGASLYALKAVKNAGKPVEEERSWQDSQLPKEIRNFVLASREEKERHFKL